MGATKLCKEIKRADGGRTNWQRLFEPYDFFKSYKNYLQVGLEQSHSFSTSFLQSSMTGQHVTYRLQPFLI